MRGFKFKRENGLHAVAVVVRRDDVYRGMSEVRYEQSF